MTPIDEKYLSPISFYSSAPWITLQDDNPKKEGVFFIIYVIGGVALRQSPDDKAFK